MKDKKILILAGITVILLGVLLFLSRLTVVQKQGVDDYSVTKQDKVIPVKPKQELRQDKGATLTEEVSDLMQ
ncbi:MAG: hypothetical protein ABIC18_02705, partial [Candidatus Omnitrophota bacterium]